MPTRQVLACVFAVLMWYARGHAEQPQLWLSLPRPHRP